MKISRSSINFVIAAIVYFALVFREGMNSTASFLIGLLAFGLLQIQHALKMLAESYPSLPFAYKAEIVITPNFRKLMTHDFVRDYYNKALPLVDAKNATEKMGKDSLWSIYSLRFLVISNLFWIDFRKTFVKELRIASRILDYNLSEEDEEPNLDIEIKSGLLRFWFSSSRMFSDKKPQLICEFPLFIYDDIPRDLMNIRFGTKTWDSYLKLRKLSDAPLSQIGIGTLNRIEKSHIIREAILNEYGFEGHSKGEIDFTQDRDGDSDSYDPNDGFTGFKNDYFVIQIKELLDE